MGCIQPLEIQSDAAEPADEVVIDVSNIQLSEDSPLEDMGDYYLLGGDMHIPKNDPLTARTIALLSGDPDVASILDTNQDRGCVKTDGHYNSAIGYTLLWEDNTMDYYFSNSGGVFTEDEKNSIRGAMRIIELYCDFKFIEAAGPGHHHYRIFKDLNQSSGGYSTIGEMANPYYGVKSFLNETIIHELLHGMGVSHEHQRHDRDQYIKCVDPAFQSKFDNDPQWRSFYYRSTINTPYDYKSIMHYNDSRIAAFDGTVIIRDGLSELDKYTLRWMYGAPARKNWQTGVVHNTVKMSHPGGSSIRKFQFLLAGNEKAFQVFSLRSGDIKMADTIPVGGRLGNTTYKGNEEFIGVGTFGRNDEDAVLVKSDEGIYLARPNANTAGYGSMYTKGFARNNTKLGWWHLNVQTDEIVAIADFDGDTKDEVLIRSPWGFGLLDYIGDFDNGYFQAIVTKEYGTNFGGWKSGSDHKILGVGDFNNDEQQDFIIQSSWGTGILTFDKSNNSFNCIWGAPFGSWFNEWSHYKNQKVLGTGNFDGKGGDEILIESDWGVGILQLGSGGMKSILCKSFKTLHADSVGWTQTQFDDYDDMVNAKYGRFQLIHAIEDLDDDGDTDVLVQLCYKKNSDWFNSKFIKLSLDGSSFRTDYVKFYGVYHSLYDQIMLVEDFDNDNYIEVLTISETNDRDSFHMKVYEGGSLGTRFGLKGEGSL